MMRIGPLLAVAALSMALGACNRQGDPNAAAQPAPGASGKGAAAANGQPAPSGTGLNGGLGTANPTQSAGAGPDDGSKNRTTHNSVGNR